MTDAPTGPFDYLFRTPDGRAGWVNFSRERKVVFFQTETHPALGDGFPPGYTAQHLREILEKLESLG